MSQQMYAHLGERFLYYRLILPDRKEVGMRAMKNESSQTQMSLEIRNAMYSFMKGLDLTDIDKPTVMTKDVQEKLVDQNLFGKPFKNLTLGELVMEFEVWRMKT
jgi:hypothetical protein